MSPICHILCGMIVVFGSRKEKRKIRTVSGFDNMAKSASYPFQLKAVLGNRSCDLRPHFEASPY